MQVVITSNRKIQMKIVVYTIVKNAEPYIAKYIESARDADLIILGDTGSTDRTVAVARKHGAIVYKIKPEEPFHFGNARNALLEKLPKDTDICVSLDADEVLAPNWREALEKEWSNSIMLVSWNDNGILSWIPRIHPRSATWVGRIHEFIYLEGPSIKCSVKFIHHRDTNRDRSFYIDLLQMQIDNGEHVARSLCLLGKEYAVRGYPNKAIDAFEEYFETPTDYMEERASAANMMYYLTKDVKWLYRSIWYCPPQRDAYQRLAVYMAHNDDWTGAYHYASMGIEYNPLDVFSEYPLTDEAIRAILAEAAFRTGRTNEAIDIAEWLVEFYPNKGYETNLHLYNSADRVVAS